MKPLRVESNIPAPPPYRRCVYPWPTMKVGDSVQVPERGFLNARRSAHLYGERHGWRFQTNAAERRIWRVA